MSQTVRFQKEQAGFFTEVRKRVNQYFKENNISKHANLAMKLKTAFILSGFLLTYILILTNWFNPWVALALAGVHGFFTALIGLNIAHDAIHGAYSSNATVNKRLGTIFNIVGANDHIWKISHNIVHHTFTNIPDNDDDIHQLPVLRLNPKQDLWWIHRFQHWYAFLLYPLASLSWVFIKDYVKFFGSKIGNYDNRNKPRKELYRLFFYKALYYVFFLVIPFIFIEFPWYYIVIGFLFLHLVEGATLSIVFQLAHVVEGTDFPEPDEKGEISNSWAIHQMYTTADFARKNPVVNFLFGGLNFQIEHHLFPNVCHIHYKNIAPIVEETAKEYNLPYIANPSFSGAINSHIKMLKTFGKQPPVAA